MRIERLSAAAGWPMRAVREKDYLELMRDLAALRRTRAVTIDPAIRDRLDRTIDEHEEETSRRDRHGR